MELKQLSDELKAQSGILRETRGTMHKVLEAVVEIKAQCKPCREEIQVHRLILNGRPGDGDSPGMRVRMELLEYTQQSQVKWMKLKIGAVLSAVIAVIGATATYLTKLVLKG